MKREYKLGMFVLVMLGIIGYFALKTDNLAGLFWNRRLYPIHGHFPSVAGMYPSAPVRLAGVKIGKVDSLRLDLDGRRVTVRMLIDKNYPLSSDARASLATVGFVGEKYVEIVYKDEYAEPNPTTIANEGEIRVIEPFSMDELKIRIDSVYARTVKLLDAVNDIIADPQSRDSLRTTFATLGSVSTRLREMLAEGGDVKRLLDRADNAASRLSEAIDAINRAVARADASLGDDKQGMLADLHSAVTSIRTLADDLRSISDGLKRGQGTAGKLLTEETLYTQLSDTAASIRTIAKDLEKKSGSLHNMQAGFGVRVDYFADRRQARNSLDLRLDTRRFSLSSALSEDPAGGRLQVTALGGRRFRSLTLSAGLFESRLAAAVRLGMMRDRLQFELFASRFYGGRTPLLRALLSFSLNRNVFVQAGLNDAINRVSRELMIGIGVGSSKR